MSAVVEPLSTNEAKALAVRPIRLDPNTPLFRPWAVDAMAAIMAHLLLGL